MMYAHIYAVHKIGCYLRLDVNQPLSNATLAALDCRPAEMPVSRLPAAKMVREVPLAAADLCSGDHRTDEVAGPLLGGSSRPEEIGG